MRASLHHNPSIPNLSRLVSDDPSRAEYTYYEDYNTEANYYGQGKSLGQPTNSKSGDSKPRKSGTGNR